MELKLESGNVGMLTRVVLIVPYGIETAINIIHVRKQPAVLIVPYGIETN